MGEENTPLFHPEIVGQQSSSSLWWKPQLLFYPLLFLQIRISKLPCCPALSLLLSFVWQKYVTFVVNVLDYYFVLILKHYVVMICFE